MNFKRQIERLLEFARRPLTLFYAVMVVDVAALLMFFSVQIADNTTAALRVVIFVADAVLMMLIYWLLPRSWRWIPLPLLWLLSGFLWANVLHFRYLHDLIPLSSMLSADNYNHFIIESLPSIVRAGDFIYLLVPLTVTALYFVIRPKRDAKPLSVRLRVVAVVCSVIVYMLGFAAITRTGVLWARTNVFLDHSIGGVIKARFCGLQASQLGHWKNNGIVGYGVTMLHSLSELSNLDLSEYERQSIASYLKSISEVSPDSLVVDANRGKNLIFIIVESLNAWALDYRGPRGQELMPVLDSLARLEGTVLCKEVVSQVGIGGSSDGQMLYNTGLLPLFNGIAAQIRGDNRFHSLVSMIKPRSSAEYIVEEGRVFNHYTTSRSYGYDMLHDNDSLTAAGYDVKSAGKDRAVFDYALSRIIRQTQPFVAEITTLSMHNPFNDEGTTWDGWIDSLDLGSECERGYLRMANYTDREIGRFLDGLRRVGLMDNSVVVIASDHAQPFEPDSDGYVDDNISDIVFMAVNTGLTRRVCGPRGQVDVFPTILDLMGVSRDGAYRGLGYSMLDSTVCSAVRHDGTLAGSSPSAITPAQLRARAVSDTILRADYFRQ